MAAEPGFGPAYGHHQRPGRVSIVQNPRKGEESPSRRPPVLGAVEVGKVKSASRRPNNSRGVPAAEAPSAARGWKALRASTKPQVPSSKEAPDFKLHTRGRDRCVGIWCLVLLWI